MDVSAKSAALLWLAAATAYAAPTAANDLSPAAEVIARLVAQPIPSRFCLHPIKTPPKPTAAATFTHQTSPEPAELALNLEQSDGTLDRLRNLRRLELLTLVRNQSAAVFFGVNEHGHVGLHFDASALMLPRH